MRFLIGCERFGAVRDAFRARGHDAWSNDLDDVEPEGAFPAFHIPGDVFDVLRRYAPWDGLIAFPPCTDLAVSGARYFAAKRADGRQQAALDFVRRLLDADVPRIALENPVGVISTAIRPPDQIIQPWQFGHPESKATCLWLKGFPALKPSNIAAPAAAAAPAITAASVDAQLVDAFVAGKMVKYYRGAGEHGFYVNDPRYNDAGIGISGTDVREIWRRYLAAAPIVESIRAQQLEARALAPQPPVP